MSSPNNNENMENLVEYHFDVYAVNHNGEIKWFIDTESSGFSEGTIFDPNTGEWGAAATPEEEAFDLSACDELERRLQG